MRAWVDYSTCYGSGLLSAVKISKVLLCSLVYIAGVNLKQIRQQMVLSREEMLTHQSYLTRSSALTNAADANSLASIHTQT